MNQFDEFDELDPFFSPPLAPLLTPTPAPTPVPTQGPVALALPPLASYPSKEALFEAIQSWAKPRGYAFIIGRSKRLESRRQKVYYACDHHKPSIRPLPPNQRIRDTQTRGTGCLFSIVAIETPGLG